MKREGCSWLESLSEGAFRHKVSDDHSPRVRVVWMFDHQRWERFWFQKSRCWTLRVKGIHHRNRSNQMLFSKLLQVQVKSDFRKRVKERYKKYTAPQKKQRGVWKPSGEFHISTGFSIEIITINLQLPSPCWTRKWPTRDSRWTKMLKVTLRLKSSKIFKVLTWMPMYLNQVSLMWKKHENVFEDCSNSCQPFVVKPGRWWSGSL